MSILSGVKILITRPAHQTDSLVKQLNKQGAEVICFPVIAIKDCHRSAHNLARIRRLNDYDLIIFISQNAVEYGLKLLNTRPATDPLPPVAAIGRSTAKLLEQHHIPVAACPILPSSQQLLDTPTLQALPTNSQVLIFRGCGGKEVLARILKQRGINTDYAEVYERIKPDNVSLSLTTDLQLIMVTSRDSLQNLYELTEPESRDRLLQTRLLIGSATMLDEVSALKFKHPPIIARSPLDEDMVEAAIQWQQQTFPASSHTEKK